MLKRINDWARALKKQILIVYFSYKDKRTPWYAKIFAALIVAYAFSPIDLIPDFIPILGYLDDIIIVPIGIMIALKLMPGDVLADAMTHVEDKKGSKPKNWLMAGAVLILWFLLFLWLARLLYNYFFS
ncbi:YkvA family protein [Bacillus sp. CECT 9360]|uniref:YkvA family protein n=1 Tax=Bacillus sp. CECT 9360 TaxID=2845821 RepID=UPI001E469B36|nr:YkvA family protein [Bacillus sp. CECT 9360]CAH0344575.1 hypothetical protein BCI9360_00835 [Bacillus sp. CECT 9360]